MARLIVVYTSIDPNIGGTEITSRIFQIDNEALDAALRRYPYTNVTLSYEVDEKGNVVP